MLKQYLRLSVLSKCEFSFIRIISGKENRNIFSNDASAHKLVPCRMVFTESKINIPVIQSPFQKYVPHLPKYGVNIYQPQRQIWGWLNSIFNRVDESRILDAGPDRACAEWLLRCGAGVRWMNSDKWIKDYNSLPLSGGRIFKIEEVDATDSAVMHIGFPHFRNCRHIRRMVLHRATYLDDDAMEQIYYLKGSLKELQLSSCGNISRKGLNHIKKLSKLEYLLLYDLPLIEDKEEVIKDLEKALPNCTILFPYAQASERPQEEENT